MAGIMLDAMLDLAYALPPANTQRALVFDQVAKSVERLRLSFSETTSLSARTYNYTDTPIWYDRVSASIASNYVAGTGSIQLVVPSYPSTTLSPGCRIIIGTENLATSASAASNGSGLATFNLGAGSFTASIASGTNIWFVRDAATPTPDTVDLNGFYAHLAAWRSAYATSSTDADEARALYKVIGATPRNGGAGPGPYISQQKQWDESFHVSQQTQYWLSQSLL